MATQVAPSAQLALLVQDVKLPHGTSFNQMHTTLPSALRLHWQSTPVPGFVPHFVTRPPLGHICVVLAGQMLPGKQEPA
jgi:hypothetical protein